MNEVNLQTPDLIFCHTSGVSDYSELHPELTRRLAEIHETDQTSDAASRVHNVGRSVSGGAAGNRKTVGEEEGRWRST